MNAYGQVEIEVVKPDPTCKHKGCYFWNLILGTLLYFCPECHCFVTGIKG